MIHRCTKHTAIRPGFETDNLIFTYLSGELPCKEWNKISSVKPCESLKSLPTAYPPLIISELVCIYRFTLRSDKKPGQCFLARKSKKQSITNSLSLQTKTLWLPTEESKWCPFSCYWRHNWLFLKHTSVCVLLSVKPFSIPCSALSNCKRHNIRKLQSLETQRKRQSEVSVLRNNRHIWELHHFKTRKRWFFKFSRSDFNARAY